MRNCGNCKKNGLCDELVNQNKEFPANLNELNRQPPGEFGVWSNVSLVKNKLNVKLISVL